MVFLFFLALGSLTGAVNVHRARRPDLVFLWGQWGVAVWAALALVLLVRLPVDGGMLSGLYHYWNNDAGIEIREIIAALGWPPGWQLVRAFQIYVLLPVALIAVPTFLMGWTYAHIQRTVQTDPRVVGWRVGLIQTANIAGSMLGSLLTGALFLGWIGTPGTLSLLVLVAASFGCLAVARSGLGARPARVGGVLGVSLLLAWAVPDEQRFWARLHGSPLDEVVVAEDASSVVAMQRLQHGGAILRVNGTGMSMMPYGQVWNWLGLVPALLHPNPKNVLLIGLGTGNTAWAVGAIPEVERIDVYEIAKPELEILERTQSQWFDDPAVDHLLRDPRLNVHFSDGRLAMRLGDRRYDLIEADALEPYMAYSGNLYSKEFYELVQRSLKPGGLLCTYAPTERVKRTVLEVFPHVLSLDWFMIASDQPIRLDRKRFIERFRSEAVQRYLRESGRARQVNGDIAEFLQGVRVLEITPENRNQQPGGDINTDLFPRDEYEVQLR